MASLSFGMDSPNSIAPKEDWNISRKDIVLGELIGEGSFGRVFKAKYMGIEVAAKQILTNVEQAQEFEHEVAVLRALRHPLIVLWMGVCRTEDSVLLVQEYISGGSLHKILQNQSIVLPWLTRVKMALEIAQALLFLHKRNVLHRDLKAENVLIEAPDQIVGRNNGGSYGRCKLADFGLSTLFNGKVPMSEVGTPWWRAPELSTHIYGTAADVFSFGVVLFELLTRACGDDIRAGMTFERKKLEFFTDPNLLEKDPQFAEEFKWCPPDFKHLAVRCCNDDPSLRPSTEEVVSTLDALYQKLNELNQFAFNSLKTLDPALAAIESHNDIADVAVHNSFKIWVAAACSQLQLDSVIPSITVPCSLILQLIQERILKLTGKTIDQTSKEFLCSVVNLHSDSKMSIEHFSALWKWYNITEHVILHPLILPHFQDGFVMGFVGSDLATQLLAGKEEHLLVRFSGTKPGCVVITCNHNGQARHVLVGFEYMENPANGCFVLGTTRCRTLKEVLTKHNLQLLRFVYPHVPVDSEVFKAANTKAEAFVSSASNNANSASATRYDIDTWELQTRLESSIEP